MCVGPGVYLHVHMWTGAAKYMCIHLRKQNDLPLLMSNTIFSKYELGNTPAEMLGATCNTAISLMQRSFEFNNLHHHDLASSTFFHKSSKFLIVTVRPVLSYGHTKLDRIPICTFLLVSELAVQGSAPFSELAV